MEKLLFVEFFVSGYRLLITKIGHLNEIFQIFSDNQWQKLWEKLVFGQFRVSASFPFLTMLRNNEQNLRQAVLWVRNIAVLWVRNIVMGPQHCIGEEGDF